MEGKNRLCFTTAIIPGVCEKVTGGTQNLKSPQNKPIPVFYLYKTEHQWGYGVCRVLQSCLGGKIMIWGSASIKWLITPSLQNGTKP